ncbi:STAS domain-containing protein [Streptosporangium sp. NPDC004379]|uniref:STAS domain-containing protein n=1 Tax=Streptosporangium sp. NPDC004379 TaxID=3366189 RepID=UPI0036781073
MNGLTVGVRAFPDGTVLEVAGDLDFATVGGFHDVLPRLVLRPGQRLVIDLSGLTFCDSTGITAFLAARNVALEAGADVALAAVPAPTLRVLGVIGLDQVLTVHPDAAAAGVPAAPAPGPPVREADPPGAVARTAPEA